ncbi:hypothetical protein COO60DRAFT_907482 [Scenedesmus sp. NREL 46B-D3]|nr:hypothetical protein COO60DRAFT_907482 [Scenedesmus sp. NREL 46B-D3]
MECTLARPPHARHMGNNRGLSHVTTKLNFLFAYHSPGVPKGYWLFLVALGCALLPLDISGHSTDVFKFDLVCLRSVAAAGVFGLPSHLLARFALCTVFSRSRRLIFTTCTQETWH